MRAAPTRVGQADVAVGSKASSEAIEPLESRRHFSAVIDYSVIRPAPPAPAGPPDLNVAVVPHVAYTEPGSNKAWVVRVDPGNSTLTQILINNVPTYSVPTATMTSLSVTFTGSNDSLTIDNVNGPPVGNLGTTFDGTAVVNNNKLAVLGTSAGESVVYATGSLTFAGKGYAISNSATVSIDSKGGTDQLSVTSGVLHVLAPGSGSGIVSRTYATLAVADGATLMADVGASHGDRMVFVTSAAGFSVGATSGKFDLGDNDLIVRNGVLNPLLQYPPVYTGHFGAHGVLSTATIGPGGTTVGFALNGGLTYPKTAFDGVSVSGTDMLVGYTLIGDYDLNFSVDIIGFNNLAAYFAAAQANLSPAGTWASSDFDYDSGVSIADFNAFAGNFPKFF